MARRPETAIKRALMNTIGFLKWGELHPDDVYKMGLSGIAGIGVERVFLSPDVNSLHIVWTDRANWIMHEIADYPYPDDPTTLYDWLEGEIGGDSWETHEPDELTIWEALSDYGNEHDADNPPKVVTLEQLKAAETEIGDAAALIYLVAHIGKSDDDPEPTPPSNATPVDLPRANVTAKAAKAKKLTPAQQNLLTTAAEDGSVRVRWQGLRPANTLTELGYLEPFNQDYDYTEYMITDAGKQFLAPASADPTPPADLPRANVTQAAKAEIRVTKAQQNLMIAADQNGVVTTKGSQYRTIRILVDDFGYMTQSDDQYVTGEYELTDAGREYVRTYWRAQSVHRNGGKCLRCNGQGSYPLPAGGNEFCGVCGGRGKVTVPSVESTPQPADPTPPAASLSAGERVRLVALRSPEDCPDAGREGAFCAVNGVMAQVLMAGDAFAGLYSMRFYALERIAPPADPTPPAAAASESAIPANITGAFVSHKGVIVLDVYGTTVETIERSNVQRWRDVEVELVDSWQVWATEFGAYYTRRQPATDGAGEVSAVSLSPDVRWAVAEIINDIRSEGEALVRTNDSTDIEAARVLVQQGRIKLEAQNYLGSRQYDLYVTAEPSTPDVPATDGAGEYDHDAQIASIAADMKAHVEKVGGPAIASVMFELSFGQNPDGQDVADAFDEFQGTINGLKAQLAAANGAAKLWKRAAKSQHAGKLNAIQQRRSMRHELATAQQRERELVAAIARVLAHVEVETRERKDIRTRQEYTEYEVKLSVPGFGTSFNSRAGLDNIVTALVALADSGAGK